MPITTAFIKETVRLANITELIIPRKVTGDIKLPNGDIMPTGTQWTIDIQRMGQVRNEVQEKISLTFLRPTKKSGATIRSNLIQIVSWMVMPTQCIPIRIFLSRPVAVAVLVVILRCKS